MVIDGIYYALAFGAAAAVVSWLAGPAFGLPLLAPAAFCAWFFRDPEREPPSGPVAVSPADGKVISIKAETPAITRVSIFMNVFDVHVNRAPLAGTITELKYTKGCFKPADREECSTINEQNFVVIQGEGTQVAFKQIAGLIARRIIFFKKPGDSVAIGERVGLIKFGSRVDVLLGPEWNIEVKTGMRVRAGVSVLARRQGI
ncbi:MAG TPA: phosphatidylserine decarboxylase [Bryobacteraceae bacterium]|nr:phosphatidylserine decarboxylase [Bryobacteraceae bacterium]